MAKNLAVEVRIDRIHLRQLHGRIAGRIDVKQVAQIIEIHLRDRALVDDEEPVARALGVTRVFPPHRVHQKRQIGDAVRSADLQVADEMVRRVSDGDCRLPCAVVIRGEEQLARCRVRHLQPEHEERLRIGVPRERRVRMHSSGQRIGNVDHLCRAVRGLDGELEKELRVRRRGAVVQHALHAEESALRRDQHVAIDRPGEDRRRKNGQSQNEKESFHSLRFTMDRRSIANSSDFRFRNSG